MNQYDDRIWVLITRELSNEASPEERRELQAWLAEAPDHQSFFNEIKHSWEEQPTEAVDSSFMFDLESGRRLLRKKLEKEEEISGKPIVGKPQTDRFSTWKIAATIFLLVISLSAVMTAQFWEAPMVRYATSNMEQRIITLPDGSEVRLNRDSEISFAENLAGKTRELHLEGEAFFEITKNPDRPFFVYTDDAVVKVLGTSFNVKENNKNEVIVAVKEGLVSLDHHGPNKEKSVVRLSADELGILSENVTSIAVEQADVGNYLSWMSGELAFDDMYFDRVVKQLERIYGIECELADPSLANLRLTAYSDNVHLDEVLQSIALALDITYQKHQGTVTWRKAEEEGRITK